MSGPDKSGSTRDRRKKTRDNGGVSRRDFLKTAGLAGTAASISTAVPTPARAQGGAKIVGPGEVPVTLTINGKPHTLKIEPRVTLLDACRNRLDMTGVKRVCDRGTCGACTMLMDGKPIYACSTLAIEAVGHRVRTIEGVTAGTVLANVQAAFVEHDALMCGFCTPGFVMAVTALLEKNPKPSREEAYRELNGNICRCGTYPRVLEVALGMPPKTKMALVHGNDLEQTLSGSVPVIGAAVAGAAAGLLVARHGDGVDESRGPTACSPFDRPCACVAGEAASHAASVESKVKGGR